MSPAFLKKTSAPQKTKNNHITQTPGGRNNL